MGIISNITLTLPDSIVAASVQKEVIYHSCPGGATDNDVTVTAIICGAVVLSLIIISVAIGYCVRKIQTAKITECEKRKEQENDKIEKEQAFKERKDRYDSAWRTVQHYWKLEENKKKESDKKNINIEKSQNQDAAETVAIQIDPIDKEREAKAWKYIEYYWSEGSVRSSEN